MTIRVQMADFDTGAEIERLHGASSEIGGVAAFVGVVRDRDARLEAMTLEHYPGMTERKLAEIETEARRRWPLDDCLIVHRYGRLEPGDRIVLVATAAAHREPAFAACEFLVDYLKTEAPFWKLEETKSGASWVEARDSDATAAQRWQGKRED